MQQADDVLCLGYLWISTGSGIDVGFAQMISFFHSGNNIFYSASRTWIDYEFWYDRKTQGIKYVKVSKRSVIMWKDESVRCDLQGYASSCRNGTTRWRPAANLSTASKSIQPDKHDISIRMKITSVTRKLSSSTRNVRCAASSVQCSVKRCRISMKISNIWYRVWPKLPLISIEPLKSDIYRHRRRFTM